MPMLRGGCFGRCGTTPIVYAAAHLLSSGEIGGENPRAVLEAKMNAKLIEILPLASGEVDGIISSSIRCPVCSQEQARRPAIQ